MTSKAKAPLPERVPFSATPPGETPDIRRWAQPVVWTDRMLSTLLENQVRGGKWHALIDKVYAELNLFTAARKVTGKKKAAGVDGQSCEEFEEHLLVETRQLAAQIKDQTYRPSAVRRVHIPKPGRPNETRPLGIPTVRDRVVQRAIVNVIEPILDHQFHERSFGFRHGRGAHDALRIVEQKLQEGYVYVVDADLKGYFDTIPKDRLLALVKEHISDSRMLKLIKLFLDQNILEELREWTPIAGVPQGAVLSPVLSNLYLNPLDHQMADNGFEMVRYADDFVVLCRSQSEAESALQMIPATNALLSLLVLKLLDKERLSHIDDFNCDEALGLFAGLNILPKKSFATNYSYRTTREHQVQLLERWIKKLSPLLFSDATSFSLDFHVEAVSCVAWRAGRRACGRQR